MSEQTTEVPSEAAEPPVFTRSPDSPLYAPPMTRERMTEVLARLERSQSESRDLSARISAAWSSPEAEKIRDVVRQDGNVDWPEFVKHCGGILEAVAMVDGYGLPDTDRIIPKVDELFNKWAQAEVDAGSVFRKRPRNRPYVAGRGTSVGEARAAQRRSGGSDPREGDAETLLRKEAEASALNPHMRRR